MRRIVEPQGERTVTQSPADRHLHGADAVEAACVSRKKALSGCVQSLFAKPKLPAVRVTADSK